MAALSFVLQQLVYIAWLGGKAASLTAFSSDGALSYRICLRI